MSVTEPYETLQRPKDIDADREASPDVRKTKPALDSFMERAERLAQLSRQRQEEEASEARLKPTPIIAKEAIEAEAVAAKQEVGFSARLLVQATLPHSKPEPDTLYFERSNGFVTVTISGLKTYGLPYGTYPRLLLAWVTTEAVRTKCPELVLGDSLAAFMAKLDLGRSGGSQGSVPRLRQHMTRLFTSSISATVERKGEIHSIGFRPVENFSLFWNPRRPSQGTLWQSSLRLSPLFFEEITKKPVPVDMAALRALAKARSPLAIDIYQWLTFRMSYLRQPVSLPWSALQLQFGGNYSCIRDFRKAFLGHLKQVLKLYPQANVQPTESGLQIRPSRTHVPMRLISGSR